MRLASFGVATGFALSARSIYASAECGSDDFCSDEGVSTRTRAREHGNIATVAATVGLASALAAGTLWLTGGRSSPERSSTPRVVMRGTVSVRRADGVGFVLEGSY
jgi:hypothetical protein